MDNIDDICTHDLLNICQSQSAAVHTKTSSIISAWNKTNNLSPCKNLQWPRVTNVLLTHTLPETNIAPENGWLEYDPFLLGFGLFSGAVSC